MSINRRLDDLEKNVNPGKVVTVSLLDEPPEEERARRIAEAKAAAGPNGDVLIIAYSDIWPPVESDRHIEMNWGPEDDNPPGLDLSLPYVLGAGDNGH